MYSVAFPQNDESSHGSVRMPVQTYQTVQTKWPIETSRPRAPQSVSRAIRRFACRALQLTDNWPHIERARSAKAAGTASHDQQGRHRTQHQTTEERRHFRPLMNRSCFVCGHDTGEGLPMHDRGLIMIDDAGSRCAVTSRKSQTKGIHVINGIQQRSAFKVRTRLYVNLICALSLILMPMG